MSRRLAFFIFILMTSSLCAQNVATGDWLELIDTSRLYRLRDDAAMMISSYDPTGGNDDGFSGQHSYLRVEDGKYVVFDAMGPGCLYRIWSANPDGNPIEFYFDDETTPRLKFDAWKNMFLDQVEPFTTPLSMHVIGGWTSYVPLAYEKRLKIVTANQPKFLQFSYTEFNDGEGVQTFTPEIEPEEREKIERVRSAWSQIGEHPMPELIKQTESYSIEVAPGEQMSVFELEGAGVLHSLRIETLQYYEKQHRLALLRINADGGEPEIECPFGDFFLQAFPESRSNSLLCGLHPKNDELYYCYWPMPYEDGLRLELKNESFQPIRLKVNIGYQPMERLPADSGRLNVHWRRQDPTVAGELFPILNAQGRGHWCGVSMAMQGKHPELGYLEGDEKAWIDDRDHQFYNGTGSEDYYNGGWYFGTTGSFPYYGCGVYRPLEGRCHAFRIHMTDLVPFQERARIGIEHGPVSDIAADYSGTIYWYGAPAVESVRPELASALDRLWSMPPLAGFNDAAAHFATGWKAAPYDASEPELLNTAMIVSNDRAVVAEDALARAAFDFEVEQEAIYELIVRAGVEVTDTERGIFTIRMPGEPALDKRIVVDADEKGIQEIAVGKTRLGAGPHRWELVVENGDVVIDAFRLNPPEPTRGQYEIELLEPKSLSGAIIVREDLVEGASGDSMLTMICSQVGSGLAFTQQIERPGRYEFLGRFRKLPAGGRVQLYLNGEPLGEPYNTRAVQPEWSGQVVLGVTPKLEPGSYRLELISADNEPTIDPVRLGIDTIGFRQLNTFEGESMQVTGTEQGDYTDQKMLAFGKQWSGDGQLWFRTESVGAWIELAVEIKERGDYNPCIYFTKATDYGIVQSYVNGESKGSPFDAYHTSVTVGAPHCLGSMFLEKGMHRFRFEIVGKNEKSTNYLMGIDKIVLE